jgi:hypothetical protein
VSITDIPNYDGRNGCLGKFFGVRLLGYGLYPPLKLLGNGAVLKLLRDGVVF